MSLINDALKRARGEVLRQEASAEGIEYRAVPAHSRRTPRALAQIAGWAVAAVALGLLIWVALRPPRQAPAGNSDVPATAELAPPATNGAAVQPKAESGPSRPTTTAAVTPHPLPGPAEVESDVGADGTGAAALPSPSTTPVPEVPRPEEAPATAAARAQLEERLEDGATYLRRAAAADGSSVELGGIAFSEERPIAVINGSVVAPGDMIAGFTIVRIEPERVELEADGVRIFLALH